jgi:hypothetical protein
MGAIIFLFLQRSLRNIPARRRRSIAEILARFVVGVEYGLFEQPGHFDLEHSGELPAF